MFLPTAFVIKAIVVYFPVFICWECYLRRVNLTLFFFLAGSKYNCFSCLAHVHTPAPAALPGMWKAQPSDGVPPWLPLGSFVRTLPSANSELFMKRLHDSSSSSLVLCTQRESFLSRRGYFLKKYRAIVHELFSFVLGRWAMKNTLRSVFDNLHLIVGAVMSLCFALILLCFSLKRLYTS